jgi:ribonuclease BN (tRNA processing enzyme)
MFVMKKIIIALVLSGFTLLQVTYAAEQLTATIIGSGSPIYNENRASASTLISAGDTHILVDMGNGTQANLNKLGFDSRTLTALIFTHHHLDHNEEFVPMFIRSLLGRDTFSIMGPPNTVKLTESNLALYDEDISYRLSKTNRTIEDRQKAFEVKDLTGGESFKIGDILVTTLQVPHTIYTLAYRFDYHDQSLVITGDLTYSDDLSTLAKNADFMIIDSGGMVMKGGRRNNNSRGKNVSEDSGNKGSKATKNSERKSKKSKEHAHLNLADSSKMAELANVKTLVYTHFNSTTVDTIASLNKIQKNYRGNVIFGEDLMVLTKYNNPTLTSAYRSTNVTSGYPIVDTGQRLAYSNNDVISLPVDNEKFFGQDASYLINAPSYTDNLDGTITDNVTGLIWQKEMGHKLTFEDALKEIDNLKLGGYSDWRVPTIKELYSLIQFSGSVKGEKALYPFIDTRYFNQPIGDTRIGEREIDAQTWSSTEYVAKTMKNDDTVFGVNFVDGRIKGYPKYNPRTKEPNKMYFRFVRGNTDYGKNSFVDNGDGTISDSATQLMWQQQDSTQGLNWQEALKYAEQSTLGGYNDWRLPNAKELQSIVDYTRSPETSNSAAIDPIFKTSSIINEGGEQDYPYYWSSTTHLDGLVPEAGAVYLAFGKALGKMRGKTMDVHGAGSQRSDPKTGTPMSRGPQGDMIRVNNYVRMVRGGDVNIATGALKEIHTEYGETKASLQSNDDKSQSITEKNKPSPSVKLGKPGNSNFINRLDKNKDGKVALTEFKHGEKRFRHLDKNNDGFISADEAPTGLPKQSR